MKKNYDRKDHIQRLGNTITRMSNYHFKWYMLLIAILAFNITIFTFIYNPNITHSKIGEILLTAISILTVLSITILAIYNSNKYLNMERCFRALQKEVKQYKINEYTHNFSKYKKEVKSFGFIESTYVIITILTLIIIIVIPLSHFI